MVEPRWFGVVRRCLTRHAAPGGTERRLTRSRGARWDRAVPDGIRQGVERGRWGPGEVRSRTGAGPGGQGIGPVEPPQNRRPPKRPRRRGWNRTDRRDSSRRQSAAVHPRDYAPPQPFARPAEGRRSGPGPIVSSRVFGESGSLGFRSALIWRWRYYHMGMRLSGHRKGQPSRGTAIEEDAGYCATDLGMIAA